MSDQLLKLRSKLALLNQSLLKILSERKFTAGEIQIIKDGQNLKKYDPKREYDLFMSMRVELSELSDLELEAFSLLMQDHAGEGYPDWNKGIHLKEGYDGPKLNPLLLLIFRPSKLNLDALKDEFSDVFGKLLSE